MIQKPNHIFTYFSDRFFLFAGLTAVSLLIWNVMNEFRSLSNYYGTANAPNSDALLWLEGGIRFLFGLQPMSHLYRPTVGLLWSSILTATGRTDFIPIFFIGWTFFIIVTTLFLSVDSALKKAITIWLVASAGCFSSTWATLNIATINLDSAAFALTLTGTIFFLDGKYKNLELLYLIVGSLCLGVAAAIRGPMMLGAIPFILFRLSQLSDKKLSSFVIAIFFWSLPCILDIALQKHFSIINNGLENLFCVYSDQSHSWNALCAKEYETIQPSSIEVLQRYFQFIFSPSSKWFLFLNATLLALLDFKSLHQPTVLLLLIISGFRPANQNSSILSASNLPQSSSSLATLWIKRHLEPIQACKTLFISGFIILEASLPAHPYWWPGLLALSCVSLAFAVSWWLRLWRPLLCFSAYAACIFFLCLIGLPIERLQNTFSFLLYLGIGLFILDFYRENDQTAETYLPTLKPALGWLFIVLIGYLYIGSFSVFNSYHDTYQNNMLNQQVAIKISDDIRLNRSLYFAENSMIYTYHDDFPLWTIRSYNRLALNNLSFVDSFFCPNIFF
jgi:hypothetical protein